MVKCQVVMDALERIAPHHLAEDWDNPGLLVGSPERQVSRILVALDVSDIVVRQAVHEGAEMIVAHHPLLFKPIKKIRTDEPLGHRLQVLLQHDIAVAAAHTNLDIARGGVNDVLAEAIGLSKLSSFVITQQGEGGETESLGRIGSLPQPMAIRDFAKQHALIFFVSGKKSSNGKILFNECKKVNPNSFLVDDPEEIDFSLVEHADTIGICGATSTPKWLMEACRKAIEEKTGGTVNEMTAPDAGNQ